MRILRTACFMAAALFFFVVCENAAKADAPPIHCQVQPKAGSASPDCGGGGGGGSPPPQNNTWANNGIISMNIDENGFPMISNLSVLGNGVMYFDNAGAGLQMDARSSLGNAYNPTQAGDCAQNPSKLLGLNTAWGGNGIGIPASYGIQWRVQPRNYNQPGATCPGAGALLPYEFDFAATLGDGVHLPQQGMIIDMSITPQTGSQPLERGISELPAFFPLTYYFSLAYWSPDGVSFYPCDASGYSNDTSTWPLWPTTGVNCTVTAKAIMLCGTFNDDTCLALYSNQATTMGFTHVEGAKWNETAMSVRMVGSGYITDLNTHTGVRLLAVGNPSTIQAVIAAAKAHITNWGDL